MSHESSNSDYGPSATKKAMANLVAGTIIGIGHAIYTVFRGIFNLLSSFV